MASVRRTPRSAASLAIAAAAEADLERVLAGGNSRYPNGVLFIPSDIATSEQVARGRDEHPLVVIVDEEGNEQWLPGRGEVEDWDYG